MDISQPPYIDINVWQNNRAKVRENRDFYGRQGVRDPRMFTLVSQNPVSGSNGHMSNGNLNEDPKYSPTLQLLFLCMDEHNSEMTLFVASIPNVAKVPGNSLPWDKLIDFKGYPQQADTTSREEQLMNERKRCYNSGGINSYQICPNSGRVLIKTNSKLFLANGTNWSSECREIVPRKDP